MADTCLPPALTHHHRVLIAPGANANANSSATTSKSRAYCTADTASAAIPAVAELSTLSTQQAHALITTDRKAHILNHSDT